MKIAEIMVINRYVYIQKRSKRRETDRKKVVDDVDGGHAKYGDTSKRRSTDCPSDE